MNTHTASIRDRTTGVPAVSPKPAVSPIEQFFRDRCRDEVGAINFVELFGALGALAGALTAVRRALSGEPAEFEPVVGPAPAPTRAPAPTTDSTPESLPGVAALPHISAEPEALAGEPKSAKRARVKTYATAGAMVLGSTVVGGAVGAKISDVQSALHRVVPDIVCVSTPPPNTDVAGYLRIGSAAEQSAETILPLQPGQSCASPTVELSMHLETTLNPPDGACVDVRIDGEAVRSYVTLDVKQPSVDLRLREGTTCEPSKNTLVTVRELKRSNGLDR